MEKTNAKQEIFRLEEDKKELLYNSGILAYNIYKEGTLVDERLRKIFAEIDKYEAKIKELSAVPEKKSAAMVDNEKFCSTCGTKNPAEALFCAGCGSPLSAPQPKPVFESEPVIAPEPVFENKPIAPPEPVAAKKIVECSICGAPNEEGAENCVGCGVALI